VAAHVLWLMKQNAPVKVADFRPTPPVAVITGGSTFSAGEAVAVAFRGRPHIKSFGAATGGAPNSPGRLLLADGAALRFALYFDVDRTGTAYTQAIAPDVAVPGPTTPSGSPLLAAASWLLSTAACIRNH
jgi:carboxyl-terminal processing protease